MSRSIPGSLYYLAGPDLQAVQQFSNVIYYLEIRIVENTKYSIVENAFGRVTTIVLTILRFLTFPIPSMRIQLCLSQFCC